ncbi:tweedleC [Cochliomyia hominivorax]
MRVFYLFICLAVASAMARPEPPVYMGLQQQNQRALPLNAHAAKPHVYQQLPLEHSFANFAVPAPSPTFGAPTAPAVITPPSPDTLAPATAESPAFEMPQEDSYNAAYRHSTSQQHESGYDNGPKETQVHKHIYVHVPPKDFEEEDAVQPRVTHEGGPKQKHYKIVFIKAPSAPAMRPAIVPPAPQNEEKTLIYVLHKKPEAQPDIVIPTPAPTKPSKPEVYFIKYKTKKEEAPVYGPPPAILSEVQPRQADDALASEENNDFVPMDHSQYEMVTTTQQPQYEEGQQQQQQAQSQFVNEENNLNNAELFNAPTMTNFVNEEAQPTALAAAEPLNQYLPPETTLAPIVVEDMEEAAHVPAATYGPPNRSRYFIKKRK